MFSRLCPPISGTRIRLISFFKVPFPNQKFLSLRSLSSSLSPSLSLAVVALFASLYSASIIMLLMLATSDSNRSNWLLSI